MKEFAIYRIHDVFFKMEYEDDAIISLKRVDDEISNFGMVTELTDEVAKQLSEYFDGGRKLFDFPFRLEGTEFQKKVWNALLEIPYGEIRTYKEIAVAIGNPNGSRAVGMANNKNPIHIVVPCHRVIGSNGKLVGYAGGLDMKRKLLEMEKGKY